MTELHAWLGDSANHQELKPVLPLGLAQGTIYGVDKNLLDQSQD